MMLHTHTQLFLQKVASRLCSYPARSKIKSRSHHDLAHPHTLFLQKVASRLCSYPAVKNFVEIALSCSVSETSVFFAFNAEN